MSRSERKKNTQEEKIRKLEEKLRELERKVEKRRRFGAAGAALQTVMGLFQGLSAIVASLENSEAFRERLEAINKRIEEGIRRTEEIKDVAGIKGVDVQYDYSVRTLMDDNSVAQRLRKARKVRTPRRIIRVPRAIEKRELLIDVFDEGDHLTVLAELPSVKLDDIKLNVANDTLTILVDTPSRKYHKEVKLPTPAKADAVKATYTHGVLKVKLEKAS